MIKLLTALSATNMAATDMIGIILVRLAHQKDVEEDVKQKNIEEKGLSIIDHLRKFDGRILYPTAKTVGPTTQL